MPEKSPLFLRFKSSREKLRRVFPWLFVFGKAMSLIFSSRSALRTSGYFKSVALKKPCLNDESPIPWMNYCAIHFLDERLQKDQLMFEYGSGNSTRWFAQRVNRVTSVENHQGWYEYVKDTLPDNVELMFQPSGVPEYANAIASNGVGYDVVVVDADERVNCMLHAAGFLSERGVIILDDAQREMYHEGIEGLIKQGFRKLDLRGIKAGGIKFYSTMIFYRNNNCLGI